MIKLIEVVILKIYKVLDELLDKDLRKKVNNSALETLRTWISENKQHIIVKLAEKTYSLNQKIETEILNLIFERKIQGTVSHYTTIDAVLNILPSNIIRLTSLVGLNDNSELNFSDLTDIKEPFHHKRIDYYNSRFILSLSQQVDDLNQWRLYGDDGKGTSLDFTYNPNYERTLNTFELRKIFYGNELILALRKIKTVIQFYIKNSIFITQEFERQRNFFKDPIYSSESEVRLLSIEEHKSPKNWYLNRFSIFNSYREYPLLQDVMTFPLELKSITLGPKCPNSDLNKAQLQRYLREKYPKFNINIKQSKINSYR